MTDRDPRDRFTGTPSEFRFGPKTERLSRLIRRARDARKRTEANEARVTCEGFQPWDSLTDAERLEYRQSDEDGD